MGSGEQGRLGGLARDLARGEVSRRTALRRLAGATLAAALPSALLSEAALAECPPKRKCGERCCPKGARCKNGKCKCRRGRKKCAGRCVDVHTNAAHCGGCGNRCGTGQSCAEGACEDPPACAQDADCPPGPPGNCQRAVCNQGTCGFLVDDTDIPSGGQCESGSCETGTPILEPVALGTACTEDGGSVCDGIGTCVECNVAGDCPAPDDLCMQAICSGGVCGSEPVNEDDGNDCTTDTCDPMTGVSHENVAAGTPCAQNGGNVCNGAGNCVECFTRDDCPTADPTQVCGSGVVCSGGNCVSGTVGTCPGSSPKCCFDSCICSTCFCP